MPCLLIPSHIKIYSSIISIPAAQRIKMKNLQRKIQTNCLIQLYKNAANIYVYEYNFLNVVSLGLILVRIEYFSYLEQLPTTYKTVIAH